MNKKQQIEEMIEVIRQNTESCKTCSWYADGLCLDSCELNEDNQVICETLYNAGYRKQSEGEWEVSGLCNPKCSLCHKYNNEKTSYCPNCGAKMKGGEG